MLTCHQTLSGNYIHYYLATLFSGNLTPRIQEECWKSWECTFPGGAVTSKSCVCFLRTMQGPILLLLTILKFVMEKGCFMMSDVIIFFIISPKFANFNYMNRLWRWCPGSYNSSIDELKFVILSFTGCKSLLREFSSEVWCQRILLPCGLMSFMCRCSERSARNGTICRSLSSISRFPWI